MLSSRLRRKEKTLEHPNSSDPVVLTSLLCFPLSLSHRIHYLGTIERKRFQDHTRDLLIFKIWYTDPRQNDFKRTLKLLTFFIGIHGHGQGRLFYLPHRTSGWCALRLVSCSPSSSLLCFLLCFHPALSAVDTMDEVDGICI